MSPEDGRWGRKLVVPMYGDPAHTERMLAHARERLKDDASRDLAGIVGEDRWVCVRVSYIEDETFDAYCWPQKEVRAVVEAHVVPERMHYLRRTADIRLVYVETFSMLRRAVRDEWCRFGRWLRKKLVWEAEI